jgi:argininosuccinate lyase
MFSVEEVNRLATNGVPFRDAYKKVGLDIEAGRFTPDKHIAHTHEGSIGNLCTAQIAELMNSIYQRFGFDKVAAAEQELLTFN